MLAADAPMHWPQSSPFPATNERGGRERIPRFTNAPCAPEPGKDAFHRVPDFAQNEWDAVERVLTILGGRFGAGWSRLRAYRAGFHPNVPPLPSPLLRFKEEREFRRSYRRTTLSTARSCSGMRVAGAKSSRSSPRSTWTAISSISAARECRFRMAGSARRVSSTRECCRRTPIRYKSPAIPAMSCDRSNCARHAAKASWVWPA